jgi:hypothetical protein
MFKQGMAMTQKGNTPQRRQRFAIIALNLLTIGGVGGSFGACNRPSEDKCRAAIINMQKLLGTDKSQIGSSIEPEVRRCRSGSRMENVDCAINATSVDQLRACKLISDTPAGSADGSATNK